MFSLGIMLFITAIMSIVQISIWNMFPVKFRDIVFANPMFAFLLNLFGSGMIMAFTGIASLVGICNLGASIVFGIYAFIYTKRKGIKGLGLDWYKLFKFIPVFPRLMVCYQKDETTWME